MTSREERLITRNKWQRIQIYFFGLTHQYLGTLAIKLFKSNTKLYLAGILTVTLQASPRMACPLLKLKCSILLVLYKAFTAK